MTPQTPAEGIYRRDYMSSTSFHVSCDCTDPDHAIDIYVSRESEEYNPYILVEFYTKYYTPRSSFWGRVKMAVKLLFVGVVSVDHTAILNDQVALNFGTALIDTVNKYQAELERKKYKKTVFKKVVE